MRKNLGTIIIYIIVFITALLWLLQKDFSNLTIEVTYKYLGQILALIGTILLSLTYVLSSRNKYVEKIFLGLDKMYRTHNTIGQISLIFLVLHPVFLSLRYSNNFNLFKDYYIYSDDFAMNLGISSLYLLVFLVVLTIYVKIVYPLWKHTHEYMGFVILLGFLHTMNVGSDISINLPLKIWMYFWCAVAIASAIYIRFFYKSLMKKLEYKVSKINKVGDVIDIQMSPASNSIDFLPGQFIYISLSDDKLDKELHPYTISSNPDDIDITISVKALGDFSKSLLDIKLGQVINVFGPYGGFYNDAVDYNAYKDEAENQTEVWVGGGIGITPFLSMLDYVVARPKLLSKKKIFFYYCTKTVEEAIYSERILNKTKGLNNIKYIEYVAEREGLINGKAILDAVGHAKFKIYMCGPQVMMTSVESQLIELGFNKNYIIFEDFSYK